MADTFTPNYNFTLPEVGASRNTWGTKLNQNWTDIDLDLLDLENTKADLANPTFTGTVTIPTVDLNGGNIDGTAIGASTPDAGTFTILSSTGNTTLGDVSGDTLTINAQSWSVPNGFSVDTTKMVMNANADIGFGPSLAGQTTYGAGIKVIDIYQSNGAYVQARSDNVTVDLYADESTGTTSIGSKTSHPFIFRINDGECARLTTQKFLKASNTGTYAGGAAGTFHEITSNVSGNYIGRTYQTSADPFGWDLAYTGATPNGTGNEFLRARDATATRFVLRSNGGIANFQANDVNLSDEREKTNFNPAKNYLEVFRQIPVETYNYIDQDLEKDPGLTLGVRAQQFLAIAPEFVHESNWGTNEEPKIRYGLYQTDIQYGLMKCIQELADQVDELRAKVEALESQQP